tara:strand:+ start:965 stop:1216 length:252 start_codon:yes stop_codon:yes gene_type:complete
LFFGLRRTFTIQMKSGHVALKIVRVKNAFVQIMSLLEIAVYKKVNSLEASVVILISVNRPAIASVNVTTLEPAAFHVPMIRQS